MVARLAREIVVPSRNRPYIPLHVRAKVIIRQLCEQKKYALRLEAGPLTWVLSSNIRLLFGEGVAVHLDHDPPLRIRAFNKRTGKYTPDANDPDYLIWRTAEAHRFKTNVRGDGAQFPDRVLIKRERRREKKAAKPYDRIKRGGHFNPKPKVSRPIPNRVNPWPPKGSRPFRSA